MVEKENSQKLFFSIGEVSEHTKVKPHVLRYWESEFKLLTPQKNSTGQRAYRKKDIDVILAIKRLLYQEKFTLAGAKKQLKTELETQADQVKHAKRTEVIITSIAAIKSEMQAIKDLLSLE